MYKPRLRLIPSFNDSDLCSCVIKPRKFPGYPRVTAPRFPPAAKWYEGKYLRSGSQLIGRAAILEEVLGALDDQHGQTVRSIALTGIGGIG